jgi:acyl carrier protein
MNETIQELETIKSFYIQDGDWDSANQITLAIDVIENYYFTIKQQNI